MAGALAGCGQASAELPGSATKTAAPTTVDVSGTFTLITGADSILADYTDPGTPCEGGGGYSDIAAGAPATLTDEVNTVLAAETLGSGELLPDPGLVLGCQFKITFTDVPMDRNFYSVDVANRGELTYSRDEMEKMDWEVSLSIGD